jgi:ADP-heptose:LPS heptosyltransferase
LLICRIDILVNLHKLYKLNLLLKLFGVRKRLGIVHPDELKETYLTTKTEFVQTFHHIIQYCSFAKQLGVACNDYSMKYYPLISGIDLKLYNLDSSQYIICCPGGGKNKWAEMSSKRWGKDSYVDLIEMSLDKNSSLKVLLVGGESDCNLNSQIMAKLNNERVINLTNKLSLDELFYLLKSSIVYLGNDSFLLHFASTAGIKTIGLFGPTSGELLAPLGGNDLFIQSRAECAPCYDANDSSNSVAYHCETSACMKNISVKEVYSLLFERL